MALPVSPSCSRPGGYFLVKDSLSICKYARASAVFENLLHIPVGPLSILAS